MPVGPSLVDIALVRYLSDGSLDTSFGTGGIVTTPAGSAIDLAWGVVLQPDGRIVVAGGAFTATGGADIAVLRYNADGSLDTTFGSDGIVTTAVATGLGADQGLSVALLPDGRIVIGGSSSVSAGLTFTNDFTLVRYNPDGSLDTTLGGLGNPTVEVGKAFTWTVPPRAFIDADTDVMTYAVTMADGTALPGWLTFNGTALTGTAPNGATDLTLRVAATDPWGASASQLLALNVENPNDAPFVANYGVPAGIVLTPVGPGASARTSPAASSCKPTARSFMAGQSTSPGTFQDFTLVLYNADGSLDTTFGGGDGIAITSLTPGTDIANSVALQQDGKILVAGVGADFALARYNADGSFDTTFGGGSGIVTTAMGASWGATKALRVVHRGLDGEVESSAIGRTTHRPAPPPAGHTVRRHRRRPLQRRRLARHDVRWRRRHRHDGNRRRALA